MILQRVLISLLLALLGACSDGSDHASVTVNDAGDPQVLLESNGDIVVRVAGRTLFAMPGDEVPLARDFTETASGIGVISFSRANETVDPLNLIESQQVGAGVKLDFENSDGSRQAVLEASPLDAQHTVFRFTLTGTSADSIAVPVRCDSGGSFHGFGEQYNATDQRGEAFGLFVNEQGNGRTGSGGIAVGDEHTTYFPMPYYLDVRGFGVLFDTARRMQLDLCAADPAVAWIEVIGGDSVEWTVFHGPTTKDVIRQLADVVGRPAKLPEWAYGLWIGAQGGRDKVLAEVAALEAADIPVTALWVQDWGGHRGNFDGGDGVQYRWAPDEKCNELDDKQQQIPKDICYPNIAGMVADLHASGYRFLAYANPFLVQNLDARFLPNHFADMDAANLLMKNPVGETHVFVGPNVQRNGHADLTLPAARDYIKDALRNMVTAYGFDGWMADFSEWTPLDAVVSDGTDAIEVRNTYPTEWQRLTREVMEELRPDGDWVMFARAGWSGTQGAAQIHWVGDQETNWSTLDGLPTVVPAMLNLGLAGQPYVTHDIAGFARGTGPSDEELYMRWTELGAFTPVMRTHEGADKEGNWSWEKSPATTAHFRRFSLVHCALRPLFMALSDEAQQTSVPILRHMMLEFPDDPQTYSLSDQYMIGDTFLVAPVLEQGATTRSVYFPAGTWYNVWSGAAIAGGARVTVDAPMGSPPVYSFGIDRPELRQAEFLATASCR